MELIPQCIISHYERPSSFVFIGTHGGSTEHFGAFKEPLEVRGHAVYLFAAEEIVGSLTKKNIQPYYTFSMEGGDASLANRVVEEAARLGRLIIIDGGSSFSHLLHRALEERRVVWALYHDNRETSGPGAYFEHASQSIAFASRIFFANKNHETAIFHRQDGVAIDFSDKIRVGVGYYDTTRANLVRALRNNQEELARQRAVILGEDRGQKIITYLGANNEPYFERAFPQFLTLLTKSLEAGEDLSDYAILLHQHPVAKKREEIEGRALSDRKQLEDWLIANGSFHGRLPKGIISHWNTPEWPLALAHALVYFQTAMAPDGVFAEIPHTLQVAHETDRDALVRTGFCDAVTDEASFQAALDKMRSGSFMEKDLTPLKDELGIRDDFVEALEKGLMFIEENFVTS